MSDVLKLMLGAFRQVLNNDDLTEQDDFFHHGGDSVAAVQVVELVAETSGLEIPVAYLFIYPTAAELATMVAALPPESYA
jgi:acyl carrier protein